jgi:hypothetical protein
MINFVFRRKIESDLKLAQASIEAVERNKKEVEASLVRYNFPMKISFLS